MAVYTQISKEDLDLFLSRFSLGDLLSFSGIEAGVSNTNYFVTTPSGRYVLTLFEPHRVNADDIPSYVEYSTILQNHGVPCPKTIPSNDGAYINTLCNRPASIFSVLIGEGGAPSNLNDARCYNAGKTLAQMHLAAQNIHTKTPNHFGLKKWNDWISTIGEPMNKISNGLYGFVCDELGFINDNWPSGLPSGQIHGDYFSDNVFFNGDDVSGVIDFHFVCHDMFAYDLAIAINAWAFDKDNNFIESRMSSMMNGYQSLRLLSAGELNAFPVLLRGASLRFLLSRIEEKLKWKEGDFMIPHDPMVFEKRLKHFQNHVVST